MSHGGPNPGEAVAGGSAAHASAADRLSRSREALRLALRDASAGSGPSATPGHDGRGGAAARPSSGQAASGLVAFLDRLQAEPGAGLLVASLRLWWARHPLRLASELALGAAGALLKPVAREHPVALVASAAAAGAALGWLRPWRWLHRSTWRRTLGSVLSPALLASVLPQILTQWMGPRPSGGWLAMLADWASQASPPSAAGPQGGSGAGITRPAPHPPHWPGSHVGTRPLH